MLVTVLLLVILGIDWAIGYAIAGYVVRHGVLPNGYAFWQLVGPFLCLLVIQLYRRDVRPVPGGIKYAMLVGVIGVAIPGLIVYYVSSYVDSGVITTLANLDPIITYILALSFRVEKPNYRQLFFFLLGCTGIVILLMSIMSMNKLSNTKFNGWLIVSIIPSFCYALGTVFVSKYRPATGNVLNYSLWLLFFASIVITPLTLLSKEFYWLVLDFNSFLISLEIILSTLGYMLLFIIIQRSGPVFFL